MEKLELKHLAGYLPYDTTVFINDCKNKNTKPIHKLHASQGIGNINHILTSNRYRMVLRPLSDLTKEIEVNGEKFVPNHILSNMTIGSRISADEMFRMLNSRETEAFPYWIIQKLLEWHFDIYNLILQNLAIDINTI